MRKFVTAAKLNRTNSQTENGKSMEFSSSLLMVPHLEKLTVSAECFTFPFELAFSCKKEGVFDEDCIQGILAMFHKYCNMGDITRVSVVSESFYRVKVGSLIIAVNTYRGSSPYSYVIARYNYNNESFEYRPAVISGLYRVKAFVGNRSEHYWIAKLGWYRHHDQKNFFGVNAKIKIWCTTLESDLENAFIPMRFIRGRFICCKEDVTFDNFVDKVTVVIPVPTKSLL